MESWNWQRGKKCAIRRPLARFKESRHGQSRTALEPGEEEAQGRQEGRAHSGSENPRLCRTATDPQTPQGQGLGIATDGGRHASVGVLHLRRAMYKCVSYGQSNTSPSAAIAISSAESNASSFALGII